VTVLTHTVAEIFTRARTLRHGRQAAWFALAVPGGLILLAAGCIAALSEVVASAGDRLLIAAERLGPNQSAGLGRREPAP
jgi:hypothetical protein